MGDNGIPSTKYLTTKHTREIEIEISPDSPVPFKHHHQTSSTLSSSSPASSKDTPTVTSLSTSSSSYVKSIHNENISNSNEVECNGKIIWEFQTKSPPINAKGGFRTCIMAEPPKIRKKENLTKQFINNSKNRKTNIDITSTTNNSRNDNEKKNISKTNRQKKSGYNDDKAFNSDLRSYHHCDSFIDIDQPANRCRCENCIQRRLFKQMKMKKNCDKYCCSHDNCMSCTDHLPIKCPQQMMTHHLNNNNTHVDNRCFVPSYRKQVHFNSSSSLLSSISTISDDDIQPQSWCELANLIDRQHHKVFGFCKCNECDNCGMMRKESYDDTICPSTFNHPSRTRKPVMSPNSCMSNRNHSSNCYLNKPYCANCSKNFSGKLKSWKSNEYAQSSDNLPLSNESQNCWEGSYPSSTFDDRHYSNNCFSCKDCSELYRNNSMRSTQFDNQHHRSNFETHHSHSHQSRPTAFDGNNMRKIKHSSSLNDRSLITSSNNISKNSGTINNSSLSISNDKFDTLPSKTPKDLSQKAKSKRKKTNLFHVFQRTFNFKKSPNISPRILDKRHQPPSQSNINIQDQIPSQRRYNKQHVVKDDGRQPKSSFRRINSIKKLLSPTEPSKRKLQMSKKNSSILKNTNSSNDSKCGRCSNINRYHGVSFAPQAPAKNQPNYPTYNFPNSSNQNTNPPFDFSCPSQQQSAPKCNSFYYNHPHHSHSHSQPHHHHHLRHHQQSKHAAQQQQQQQHTKNNNVCSFKRNSTSEAQYRPVVYDTSPVNFSKIPNELSNTIINNDNYFDLSEQTSKYPNKVSNTQFHRK
ncbi:hypothetical protein SNEBB_011038 [Seison nebaliae]|nr:hypothetical protein SNEBB_011038 [Seison nebaliae]